MTGIRQSFVFALEDEFGKGKGENNKWIAPPVGSFFNSTHSRQATKIYTVGSKFYDTVAYGQLNGQFNWTFVFDYHYLEPLQLAFEKVGCTLNSDGAHYTHTFEKVNNMRIPSFTVRRKILNRIAGGPEDSDEITELLGCVVRNISFSKAAGTSQLQVTMTGFYVDERMYKGELDATDYKDYNGKLSEYMCMFIGDVSKDNYVANTESLEFSLENNSDAVYNTCSPFAGLYYEGRTNCTFGTTCYSNNPSYYKQRVYSGGYRNDVYKPMAKNMKPIPIVTLAAYDKSIRDDEYSEALDFTNALVDSDESMTVTLEDVVIKSLTWPKGNDQKLQDTISSAEFKKMTITIVNTIADTVVDNPNVDMVYNAANVVPSYGYGLIFTDPEGHAFSPRAVITRTVEGSSQQIAVGIPTFDPEHLPETPTHVTAFAGWWTKPANASQAGSQVQENDIVGENLSLYARWVHTITFDAAGGYIDTGAQKPPTTVDVDTQATTSFIETAPTAAMLGYQFIGWFKDDGSQIDPELYHFTDNITISAQWTQQITLDKGTGGTTDGSIIVTYNSESLTAYTAAVKTGGTLTGYYTTSSGDVKVIDVDGTNVSLVPNITGYTDEDGNWIKTGQNITLYAQWE